MVVASRLKVASTAPSKYGDVFQRDIRAASATTQNVHIKGAATDITNDILHVDVFNNDAVGRDSCWPTIEIILLDVDAVNTCVVDGDILVCDSCHIPSCTGIGLDPRAILAVDQDAVMKVNVRDVIVGFATNGADRESVRAVAEHVVHLDVVAARDSNTVILIVNSTVMDGDVNGTGDIKAVSVVRSGKPTRLRVWSIAGTIIENDVVHIHILNVSHFEAVCRIILNIEVVDAALAKEILNDEEVVWLRLAAI